jgi:shikimate dehydrogenase
MKDFYTFADLRRWKRATVSVEPPIRLGVFGDPVAQSLSPRMQNAALQACDLPMQDARFQIAPNELRTALQLVRDLEFVGLNLTVPHKIAALSLVDEIDATAEKLGAINTIQIERGKLIGFNTDGLGFVRAIRESFGLDLRDLRVLVLGAGGGAGRAIAAQCALEKCPRLALVNRTFDKAQRLARELAADQIIAVPWQIESLDAALAQSDLVIHATSLGIQETDPSPLPRVLLARHLVIYDLIYKSALTPLLAAAAEAGARGANGLTMLLHQGALAFERWFDRPAPLAVMRAALGL